MGRSRYAGLDIPATSFVEQISGPPTADADVGAAQRVLVLQHALA
jgi:hypothetical protein